MDDLDEALVAAAPVGIAFVDLNFRHLRANDAYAAIAGLPPDQIIGRPFREVMPVRWSRIEPIMRRSMELGEEVNDLGVSSMASGAASPARHWLLSFFPVREKGPVLGLGVTATDVTELKHAELRLHEAQAELLHVSQQSAMGQMSSAMAHEVNQPLTAVCNYIRAGLLLLETGAQGVPPGVRDIFEKAALQADRASGIVRNLREFARSGETIQRAEDLKDVVEEAISLALLAARDRRPTLRSRIGEDACWASVNRIQIQQVLVNLLNNAIEAMSQSARREIDIIAAPGDGNLIRVSIADTGPGRDEKIAQNLFKPFTTSKAEGMGVGLAICRSIVRAHGGEIWVEPNREGGAIFHFTVPRSSGPGPAAG
jgi:two-component system sensor kinase FixL